MEELKTRFGNLKYNHFKINFKGLTFEVKLLDDKATFPNDNKFNGYCEEFKVLITNGNKTIDYKFYNSIMEREISENLKLNLEQYPKGTLKIKEFRAFMSRKMWGGYDKVRTVKELNGERIYYLMYSVLNCFALDMNTETDNFKDFCDNFGYDNDSRKAGKIFNNVIEFKSKVLDLRLSEEQIKYFNEEVNQETETFSKDLRNAINTTN